MFKYSIDKLSLFQLKGMGKRGTGQSIVFDRCHMAPRRVPKYNT